MAKKKRKPEKNKRKNPPRDLPDRRAMEGMMQQLVAGLQGQANQDTPLGKAQAHMYRAFEESDEKKRIQLAKDALTISPDCGSERCIGPPFPLEVPVTLPHISATSSSSGMPLAMQSCMPR